MLLAEDLLLLLTDETTGKRKLDAMHTDPALGGAILLDLLLANKIALEGEGRAARVAVIDPVATDNRILDPALASIFHAGLGDTGRKRKEVPVISGRIGLVEDPIFAE